MTMKFSVPQKVGITSLAEQTQASKAKGKAIPVQARTDPEGSTRLRLPHFNTIGTYRWKSCQPYALAPFTSVRG
jgi:hypothetical protein